MKVIETNEYRIEFNQETGEETMEGINGHKDPFVLEFPILMDIGIMGHCENDCKFCYQGIKDEPNMPLDDFKRLIDEAKPYVNQVALGGKGDPNQHENFKEIIEYCISNGVIPNYTTSGNGLTNEQIEISKMCGAVAVSVSSPEKFSNIAIHRFIDAGIKTNIHFILSKETHHIAQGILFGYYDFGGGGIDLTKLNAVIFLLFKPQGKGKELDWKLDDRKLRIFSKMLISDFPLAVRQSKGLNYMLGADSCLINKVMKSGVELTDDQLESIDTCEGGRMSVYVTNDFKLVPCSFGNHSEGISLRDMPVKDAWNTDLFKKFRERLFEDKCCCPYDL